MAQDSRGSGSGLLKSPTHRGMEQLAARQNHSLEVAGSSPASATNSENLFFGENIAEVPVAIRLRGIGRVFIFFKSLIIDCFRLVFK